MKWSNNFLYKIRPPKEIRDKLDIGYKIKGHSVTIFEIRPSWDKPGTKQEIEVAKTTFVNAKNHWKVFWMRSNLKWENYTPHPMVSDINEFFDIVKKDANSCFFG
ncbi:MAG: DUF3024 domain-containing protein [Bacteroidetes bacterium]|nr:DUF3024 domain-containing protein [Bacteroidota bacterium]